MPPANRRRLSLESVVLTIEASLIAHNIRGTTILLIMEYLPALEVV
jgi:hypothetical protein